MELDRRYKNGGIGEDDERATQEAWAEECEENGSATRGPRFRAPVTPVT